MLRGRTLIQTESSFAEGAPVCELLTVLVDDLVHGPPGMQRGGSVRTGLRLLPRPPHHKQIVVLRVLVRGVLSPGELTVLLARLFQYLKRSVVCEALGHLGPLEHQWVYLLRAGGVR